MHSRTFPGSSALPRPNPHTRNRSFLPAPIFVGPFCGVLNQNKPLNKDTVVHLAPSRGHCSAFNPTIPPLQVALSFACSVASLSHSPSFQLPGWHGLHHGSLADYLLGWGRTSTCIAGHTKLQYTSKSKHPYELQEFPPHNHNIHLVVLSTSIRYG